MMRHFFLCQLPALRCVLYSALVVFVCAGEPMAGMPTQTAQCVTQPSEVVASYVAHEIKLEAASPASEWKSAQPIVFCSDWQGKNPDEERQTEVRVLWSLQTLYLRFECRYRGLYVFE